MASYTVYLNVQDVQKLAKLLSGDELVARPWRDGMTKLASSGGIAAQRGAPVATGKLQGKIRTKVQQRPFPLWIAIRNQARNPKSQYPYPRLLAFRPKFHHQDWLINAVMPVFNGAGQMLDQIGAAIARKWSQ